MQRLALWVERVACDPTDSEEERSLKRLFTAACVLVVAAALGWAGMYVVFGEPRAAAIPFSYSVVTAINLAYLARTRRYRTFRIVQQVAILTLPFALQLALGGFVGSSAVILWALISPLLAVMFGARREVWLWFSAFAVAVAASAAIEPTLRSTNSLPTWLIVTLFVLNIVTVSLVGMLVLYSFMGERRRLRELEVAYVNQEVMLRQSEKLATLGTLAAGVAHELNNPAAATTRGAAQLKGVIDAIGRDRVGAGLLVRLSQAQAAAVPMSSLERSDAEDELVDWLEDRGVPDPWAVAGPLVTAGLGVVNVERVVEGVADSELANVLTGLANASAALALADEIAEGARRISSIVDAMRSYTYLDQAPIQEVDVVAGLEDTLVLLGSKLGDGIVVTRDYEEHLPKVTANGGELNQVWTHIIDNAVDAMGDAGQLALSAHQRDGHVVVEITDDGPGVPEQNIARVFDPFFTTKPPGHGTGLGLNVSHNIVVGRHGGTITVDSVPGRTTFSVALPHQV